MNNTNSKLLLSKKILTKENASAHAHTHTLPPLPLFGYVLLSRPSAALGAMNFRAATIRKYTFWSVGSHEGTCKQALALSSIYLAVQWAARQITGHGSLAIGEMCTSTMQNIFCSNKQSCSATSRGANWKSWVYVPLSRSGSVGNGHIFLEHLVNICHCL